VTVPMEGLTNRNVVGVIRESEDRARAVLAEQRAVYGDPNQLERERMESTRLDAARAHPPRMVTLSLTRRQAAAVARLLGWATVSDGYRPEVEADRANLRTVAAMLADRDR